jgi:predicted MFS family arabinose efflux permease
MQAGGLIAAGLLVFWALLPTVLTCYIVWAGLGWCMAAVLYEPVFAQVGRVVADGRERIRAIATITILGGLASTVALPATAWMIEEIGWRSAVGVLAVALAVVTVPINRLVFLGSPGQEAASTTASPEVDAKRSPARPSPPLLHLIATFACSSFVSAALATNLVPSLIDRRLDPTAAASLAGLFGVMQLPGRLLVMNRRFFLGPLPLVSASLGLQIAGLAVLAIAETFPAITAGVGLFACGSGLITLARPYLVLTLFEVGQYGYINGTIARGQQLARAAGPVLVTVLATLVGYAYAFAALAAIIALSAVILRTQKDNRLAHVVVSEAEVRRGARF